MKEEREMFRRRRLRSSEYMRALVRETSVGVDDLIYPIFVVEGENQKNPIGSMPGIYQYSIDRIDEELDRIREAGVKGILIFGIPAHKDEVGSEAYNEHGIIQEAIRHIKKVFPELIVIADICLCEYTSHGHCGVIKDGEILNDETLPLLARTAVTCAQAGADMVAPSNMMDGHVAAIREALDEADLKTVPIMSYTAKMASGYYGPFRDAAHSARREQPWHTQCRSYAARADRCCLPQRQNERCPPAWGRTGLRKWACGCNRGVSSAASFVLLVLLSHSSAYLTRGGIVYII
jgi:porphobilinogen synthase